MAGKTDNSAVAVAIQTAAGTFDEPLTADLTPVSNLRPSFTPVTIANDEYTGSIVKNADAVAGSRKSFSFNVKLRPPASLPAANEFNLGKFLQALKFTEVRNATAIPSSAEAVAGSGQTTTNVRLGSSASSTADAYLGYPLIVSDNGGSYKERLTQISDYDTSKNASLPEVLGAQAAANWQIPTFIGYMRSNSSDDPIILSMQFWLDGLRYDMRDCRPTSASLVWPTSTRDQAAFPELQITIEGILDDYEDEATPSIPSLGTVPLVRDGDMWLNKIRVGSQTITLDLGLQSANPPNPNETDGSDPTEVTQSTAVIRQTRQRYLKSVIDTLAMADAQSYYPFWLQYGSGAGSMVQLLAPQVRLSHPSPDLGGPIIMETNDLLIDAIDRGICIVFPF